MEVKDRELIIPNGSRSVFGKLYTPAEPGRGHQRGHHHPLHERGGHGGLPHRDG